MDEETVKSLSDREMDLEVAERLLGYRWYERDNTGRMVQVPFMTLALSPDRIAAVGPFKLHERSVEEEDRQRAMNRPEVPRFTANWQDVFREVVPAVKHAAAEEGAPMPGDHPTHSGLWGRFCQYLGLDDFGEDTRRALWDLTPRQICEAALSAWDEPA